jgi:Tfp pilus assembly protein PilX
VTRLRNDSGMALPIALGFVLVLSIALVAVVAFSSASQQATEFSEAGLDAVAVAEAGLNHAESLLANAADPASPSALPSSLSPGTINVEGATVEYWGSLDTAADPDRWTVTARSAVAHPSGGSTVSRTVTAQFDVVVSVAGNEAWNYVFSDAPGCTYYENNVTVGAPVYTKGDLCIKNGAVLLGEKVDSYGAIQFENSGRVGTAASDASDPAVRTRLGCRNGSTMPNDLGCPEGSYEAYRSSFGNSPPNLTKPPFDPTKRSTANLGPLRPCTTSSGSVPSFTTTGLVTLMPNESYQCQAPGGELSWDNATKVLTVMGTIWFDGELDLSNNQNGRYVGQGVIYVAKKASFTNYTELCATSDCTNTGWDPSTTMLVIVSGASDVPAFDILNFAKFQGAVYAVGGFRIQNNAEMRGPVVASVVSVLNNGLPSSWPALTSLLDGMPSNTGRTVTPVPGSWRG